MKIILKIPLSIFLFGVILISCNQKEESKSNSKAGSEASSISASEHSNLNISLLLDLSDRIDSNKYPNPAMQYFKRDLGYINSIADAFQMHVKRKKNRTVDDQMQLFFDPAPSNPEINSLAEQLKIRLNRENVSKERLEEVKTKYDQISSKIYQMAINSKQYPGSDIWGFFNNKVKDYCIKDGSDNVLVVITDGYIFHKDSRISEGNKRSYLTPELIRDLKLDKEDFASRFENGGFGFISKRNDLNNLRVLVLGLNASKNNRYDNDLLKLYWTKWLTNMGITKYEIKEADLPSNLDEVIKAYINNSALKG